MSRHEPVHPLPSDAVLAALRAAGEETRLRILALLLHGELNVSDLTDILGQSQPRISRHLKLLVEAGLVQRHREGAWAFFRLADHDGIGAVLRPLLAALDPRDLQFAADLARLAAVRSARAKSAEAFFAGIATQWDRLRSLHAPDALVEGAIREVLGDRPIRALLDLGTGTGKMLQLLGPRAMRAVGVDASPAMLAVARANLERSGLTRIELRQGDIHALPVERGGFDLVIVHQVLHYLDDPARALREAAAALSPGGRLLVVDFAPHDLEFLRAEHQHRRLGFAPEQMAAWLDEAGLDLARHRDIAPAARSGPSGHALTVSLWLAQDRRIAADAPLDSSTQDDRLEVA